LIKLTEKKIARELLSALKDEDKHTQNNPTIKNTHDQNGSASDEDGDGDVIDKALDTLLEAKLERGLETFGDDFEDDFDQSNFLVDDFEEDEGVILKLIIHSVIRLNVVFSLKT